MDLRVPAGAMGENPYAPATVDLQKPAGKHYRIVFREGRDLNIFGVKDVNIDGQALRYTDHKDRMYIVYPEQVNYMEVKIV